VIPKISIPIPQAASWNSDRKGGGGGGNSDGIGRCLGLEFQIDGGSIPCLSMHASVVTAEHLRDFVLRDFEFRTAAVWTECWVPDDHASFSID